MGRGRASAEPAPGSTVSMATSCQASEALQTHALSPHLPRGRGLQAAFWEGAQGDEGREAPSSGFHACLVGLRGLPLSRLITRAGWPQPCEEY